MKNSQKLSKKESALIFGGAQGGAGSENTNKNGGNGCKCYFNDSCGVTNDNPADTTCSCICIIPKTDIP